ncbi:TRAP transporter permease [Halobellus ordinarius]|uniref:TRAP transporter permease n=1 Tax=Halobellus ordinarius TaxID=3075120 RepID=UPI00288003AE|nr:TRAP transporter fused permease subunit [Halobellus sp. ZY16]
MSNKINWNSIEPRISSFITVAAIVLWAVVIYYAYTLEISRHAYTIIFLIFILLIYSANEFIKDVNRGNRLQAALVSIATVFSVIPLGYVFLNFEALLTTRVGYAFTHEYVLAFAFTLAVIYYTWRSFGRGFLFVLLFAIFYGIFGQYFPGVLAHSGISPTRMMLILVLDIEGFLGGIVRLVAAWVALFLLYAGLMKEYGLFDLLLRAASKSRNYISSGVAQSAVLGSVAIGSIMGSQTANTGMTGSFTIPMMQENGMKGTTAGGIESVASTLGQILPPIMGAAAFIMPTLIPGISYWDVVRSGLVPALIVLSSVILSVHFAGIRQLESHVIDELVQGKLSTRQKLIEIVRFGLPFAVLLWALGIRQYTVMTSALYASVLMLIIGTFAPVLGVVYEIALGKDPQIVDVEENPDTSASYSGTIAGLLSKRFSAITDQVQKNRPIYTVVSQTKKSIAGAREGAIILAPIVIIVVAINGIVDILTVTGVPNIIALQLYQLSGGILFVATVLSILICILLGLGMPTIASYTLVALLIAPGLISQFNVPDLAAHFLVFYGAILAGLTPPIATCCAVAAGIAQASFLKTCYEAIKIAAPIFVIPISFVYYPVLVSGEFSASLLVPLFPIFVGSLAIVIGLNAPFRFGKYTTYGARGLYTTLGGVLVVFPDLRVKYLTVTALLVILAATKLLEEEPLGNIKQTYFS